MEEFQFIVSAGDVAITSLIIAITLTLWGGFLLNIFLDRGKT